MEWRLCFLSLFGSFTLYGVGLGSGTGYGDDIGRHFTSILVAMGISSLSGCVLCYVFVDFFLLGVFYHGALLEMRMRGLERWLDGVG